MSDIIYLDHAATAPMRPEAILAMTDAMEHLYGNPSASYRMAQEAKAALDQARTQIAETIGAKWDEIFFTSGGTESDNWALVGTAETLCDKGKHIVVSEVEHHAILHTCDYLATRGFEVTKLKADREGFVSPAELERILSERPDTILVSVMTANNEVGTIEPIEALCEIAHRHGVLFHTDAVQAYGKLQINVERVPVDLLSASAHKIGGPKGVGFLYIRRGVQPGALIRGGSQERARRAGTENIPGILGFAAAAGAAHRDMEAQQEGERRLQLYFKKALTEAFDDLVWNGPEPGDGRLPGNISVSFPGLETSSLLINFDMAGICASGGSACTTGALDPSHVIMAMTGDPAVARGTLRFTLGPDNTREELDRVTCVLRETVERLKKLNRNM